MTWLRCFYLSFTNLLTYQFTNSFISLCFQYFPPNPLILLGLQIDL